MTWKLRSILSPHFSRATVSIYYIFICVPCTYMIYNGCIVRLYIYYHRPDFRRQHSTRIRALTRTHLVAWWQAVENAYRWQRYLLFTYKCTCTCMFFSLSEKEPHIRTSIPHAFFFFVYISKVPPTWHLALSFHRGRTFLPLSLLSFHISCFRARAM